LLSGGYQLVGRTLPIWSSFGRSGPFTPSKPWLLRYFDQVRGVMLVFAFSACRCRSCTIVAQLLFKGKEEGQGQRQHKYVPHIKQGRAW